MTTGWRIFTVTLVIVAVVAVYALVRVELELRAVKRRAELLLDETLNASGPKKWT
jgi:hypothetical protein